LKITLEQELHYTEEQKENLKGLRQAELDKLAKQISDLQISLAFHFDELINAQDYAKEQLDSIMPGLNQSIDAWNANLENLSNLSDNAVISIYEGLCKQQECLEDIENKNQELKLAVEYYKSVQNASIIKVTTNIAEL
jgi:hypothetical protein